jgi:anti-sigma28 factor (negative regulator of flagellin synthesis)
MSTFQKQPSAAEPDLPEVDAPQRAVDSETDNQLSQEEAEQLQKERLAAIRGAIAHGDYDSEEILEKALSRMLQSLEDDNLSV